MRRAVPPFILVVCWVALTSAAPRNDLYPMGLDLSWCERRGYLDFGNDRVQEVSRPSLLLAGVFVGKHLPLGDRLRFQAGVALSYGSGPEDTLENMRLDDGSVQTLELRTSLLHLGLIPELQIPLPVLPDMTFLPRAGVGFHYARVSEREFIIGSPDFRVADPYLEEHGAFSVSGHAGAAVEFLVKQGLAFTITYALRYWTPVRYESTRDQFPLEAVPYHERFLSHVIQLMFNVERH